MPKNQKVYHLAKKVGTPMTLDQVRSGASSALPRKLCKSAPNNNNKLQNLKQVHRKINMRNERHLSLTWPIRGMSKWAKGDTTSTSACASSQVSLIAPSAADSPISK